LIIIFLIPVKWMLARVLPKCSSAVIFNVNRLDESRSGSSRVAGLTGSVYIPEVILVCSSLSQG